MQSKHKFRAWHKKRKKMYDVIALFPASYENGGEWVTALGYNIQTQQDMHINFVPKDCIVTQWLGINDKNGKPIFEGDVVKNSVGTFLIWWCEDCKSYQPHIVDEEGVLSCLICEGDYNWHEFIEDLPETEVITNDYENPTWYKEI